MSSPSMLVSLLVATSSIIETSATASAGVFVDGAVAYVAKQANRTNSIHPSRVFYPDRVYTPSDHGATGGTDELAEWHGAHAPGSWTSGFWVGVNWSVIR